MLVNVRQLTMIWFRFWKSCSDCAISINMVPIGSQGVALLGDVYGCGLWGFRNASQAHTMSASVPSCFLPWLLWQEPVSQPQSQLDVFLYRNCLGHGVAARGNNHLICFSIVKTWELEIEIKTWKIQGKRSDWLALSPAAEIPLTLPPHFPSPLAPS